MLSEGKLHHLPLPSLASTCKRYLEAVTPFLDGAGYAAASRLTEEFMAGPGPFLHAQLEKIDGYDVASFVHRFWIESYLESRAPLAIFQNPACKCDPPRVFSAAPTLAGKIAQLIDRALAVHALIEQETLPPDRSGTRLWSMDQYPYLFATSRVPGIKRDRIARYADSRHVLLLVHGKMFTLTVRDEQGVRVTIDNLVHAVQIALDDPTPGEPPLGLLTTLPRTLWAIERERLMAAHPMHAANLHAIESALLTVCIDPPVGPSDTAASRRALLGEPGNRWYDHSLQFIVSEDGMLMANMEHSMLDGYTFLRLLSEMDRVERQTTSQADTACRPHLLTWQTDDALLQTLEMARGRHAHAAGAIRNTVFDITLPDSRLLKQSGLSADFLAQFLFHLAYFRLRGSLPCTYETVSMRHFQCGRTETLRPATAAMWQAVKELDANGPDIFTALDALRAASQAHDRNMFACARGAGIDRHLFAMRVIAAQLNEPMPQLFENADFLRFVGQYDLSTGAIPASAIRFSTFGPATADGFGIGYTLKEATMRVSITATNDQHARFCNLLQAGSLQLHAFLTGTYTENPHALDLQ